MGSVQHQDGLLKGRDAFHLLPLHLNVEDIVHLPAVLGEDVAASGGELEEISVEGPEVVVAPCAAELVFARKSDL